MAEEADLAERLRAGLSLTPSRGRKLGLCALLVVAGCLLMMLGAGDPVLWGLGMLVAIGGAVLAGLVASGWQSRRRIWLAREGIAFETGDACHHVPWEAIVAVTLVGRSALARVQVTVRDIEEVVGTVRRRRRGGLHAAQRRVRRLLSLNYWGSKCHLEFPGAALGVDAGQLYMILAGYTDEPGRRAELRSITAGLEDMSAAPG